MTTPDRPDPGTGEPGRTLLHVELAPTFAEVSAVRAEAGDQLEADPAVSPHVAADLEVVIAELLANAVDQSPTRPILLSLVVDDGRVTVTVRNEFTGERLVDVPDPDDDPLAERGRGLAIVDAYTDELHLRSDGTWTTVTGVRLLDR